jgi:hypothetical protein
MSGGRVRAYVRDDPGDDAGRGGRVVAHDTT